MLELNPAPGQIAVEEGRDSLAWLRHLLVVVVEVKMKPKWPPQVIIFCLCPRLWRHFKVKARALNGLCISYAIVQLSLSVSCWLNIARQGFVMYDSCSFKLHIAFISSLCSFKVCLISNRRLKQPTILSFSSFLKMPGNILWKLMQDQKCRQRGFNNNL